MLIPGPNPAGGTDEWLAMLLKLRCAIQPANGRNHASIANLDRSIEVLRWIVQIEREKGDLR